jgi:DNA-binding transcriptional regulator YbjK
MAPLTREQYEPLFAAIPIYHSSSAVRSFVADVSGHPRTLVAVLDMLLGDSAVEPTRSRLLAALRVRLDFKDFDLKVPAAVIIMALLQQRVCLDREAAPGALTYCRYDLHVRR